MKVLVVGSGGREHAICWKLKQSPRVTELYCAPGNAGIGRDAECVPVSAEDIPGIVALAQEKAIDLAVIGPEVPLAMGIVDALEAVGVKTFGPNKKCSQLEASKAFTKSFLARHDIPTAKYKEYTDKQALIDDIGIFGWPMVIKADGEIVLINERPNFVIGGMEGMKYKEYQIALDPGDKIFLYTDGVAEATDLDNNLFGIDRTVDALKENTSADSKEVLKNVRAAVDRFVGEAEQFDDLTMLCLEYKGK